MIRRIGAYILLISVYGFTWLVAFINRAIPRRQWKPNGRIMVTGTFFNPNWYLSHIKPLVQSGVREVILVIDEPQLPLEGVRFVCWPHWMSKLLTRQGARAIWMIIAGIRYRPDLYMGYHLGPGACTALITGKLMGRPSCYQMTGGLVEIIGGGFDAVEGIGAPLKHPSKTIEKMALAIVKLFELVVVRGNKAKNFLASYDIRRSVTIITGSVNNGLQLPKTERDIHLIFVGRLSPIKQVDQFITIVDALKCIMGDVHAVIVGDGPLKMDLQAHSTQLGLSRNIEFLGQRQDVEAFLARSKVFILTSKSEGLSIAMAEAMVAGVVPVAADVGELNDLVIDGVNGYLVEPNHIDQYVKKIVMLLQNHELWVQYSARAIEEAKKHCDIEVVTGKWRRALRGVVSQASGHRLQEVVH